MNRSSVANLFFITLIASLISFGAPWISVRILGRIRLAIIVAVTGVAFVGAVATAVYAIAIHRKRGVWVTLAALPALFWPVFVASMVTSCWMSDCD
jgi:hypothetical protein